MNMRGFLGAKKITSILLVVFVILAAMVGLTVNPSSKSSYDKYKEMSEESERIVERGATIMYRNDSHKYGGALLSLAVQRGSISLVQRGLILDDLKARGWIRREEDPQSYCKSGMLFESYNDSELYDGKMIVHYVFTFNASTIKSCS